MSTSNSEFLSAEAVLSIWADDAASPSEALLPEFEAMASEELVATEDLLLRFRQAAAVLVSVRHPERLRPCPRRPFVQEDLPAKAPTAMAGDWTEAKGRKYAGAIMLRPEVRRAILAGMPDPSTRLFALEANLGERDGSLQQMFERYLLDRPPDPATLNREELQDALQISLWAEGALDGVPSPETLRPLLSRLELYAPFERLAGSSIFQGRVAELNQLRSYVGEVAPAGVLGVIVESIRGWRRPSSLPAVSVYGPGGVGKSALVARFLLDHCKPEAENRLPFAYLDFDLATLDIGRTSTIILEIARQLEIQYPDRGFGKLVAATRLPERQTLYADFSAESELVGERQLLEQLLSLLESELGPRPFIVVFDTFEEVQYRGEHRALPLWKMLTELQRRWPFLRVVLSGRSPADTLRLAGTPPEPLGLSELESGAAVRLLKIKGVTDEAVARAIVQQVGGVPLSLILAASLVERSGAAPDALANLSGRSRFWFSPGDDQIQGQLYERLLGRIHDLRVERLAHPGLVLRRIDPEVIWHVLNEPCQLFVDSLVEAQSLFEELRRETSLVSSDTLDGSLVHRPDLRRIMLKILVQRDPVRVQDIRRRAVAWYRSQEGWRARAEALYQGLHLGESPRGDEFRDPELRSSIQASIAELPDEAQTLLASYGFHVDDALLARASLSVQDSHLANRVEDLLPYGDYSVDRAYEMLAVAPAGNRASPLHRALARVLAQQGRMSEAIQQLDHGIHWASIATDGRLTLDLAKDAAWLRRHDEGPVREQVLLLLGEFAKRSDSRSGQFLHAVMTHSKDTATHLARLTEFDLWNVFPVFEYLDWSQPDLYLPIASLVHRESSPFLLVSFDDPKIREALDQFMRAFSNSLTRMQTPPGAQLNDAVAKLLKLWPYRILYVAPPYGSSGYDKSELAFSA